MTACAACGATLPDGARFCPACAAPVDAARPAEERKLATVLFADLVGSTALGEQDPERTRSLLERFYDTMAAEVTVSGGTVEKFAGDAILAAFGAPAALEDHAERALHAALAMRRRLEEVFEGRLALRVGINTGEVVVGRPREGSSWVTGDAVNVAARLEQAASPGEILVGERTAAAARGAFEFEDTEVVEAKGKPGGVPARRLVRALSLMRPRGVSGLKRAFVGRESELAVLEATYRRAVEASEPHVVTIMGDAGVGKTRLVRELWERLGDQTPEPLRRTGRCLPYGRGITYWALGEVLKEHLGLLESDPAEAALARLGGRELLGLALGLDVAGDLHPLAARDRLHDEWIAFLDELLGDRTLVVLIEDLHWAEEPLLDLLERILQEVRGPLLLLATARPELLDTRPSWGGGRRNAALLGLEPLTQTDAERLLEELLAADLPASVRDAVVSRAEGNPFFVEELVGSLVDQGVLWRDEHGWQAGELPSGYAVPDSVQAALAARIDLLDEPRKAALQAAAVIGRAFWPGPLRDLLEGGEPDLAALEERDFVRRRSGSSLAGEREYAFKHALTREVAYGSLPKARRARLHAGVAAWLERAGDGRDEWAALVAHHYAEAVRPEHADLAWAGDEHELGRLVRKAVDWLRRTAQLAIGRYEIDEGIELLEQALELERAVDRRVELWRALGRAQALRYDGEGFWKAMERALDENEDEELDAAIRAELAYETALRSGMWRHRPDADLVDGWIERALESADPKSRLRGLIAKSYWYPTDAVAEAVEATQLAERIGDPELRSFAWGARGIVSFAQGHFDHGRAWAERRFELLDQLTDPDLVADIHAAPISGCIWSGRFREARRLAGVNDELTAGLTPHHRVHGVAILLETEELLGEWDNVRALESRAEQVVADNVATPCVRNARSLLVCALASTYLGEEDDARRLEALAQEHWVEGYGPLLDTPLMRIALARGELEAVERLLAKPEPTRGWYKGWLSLVTRVARLDALAALGRRDDVEAEAEGLLRPGTYLEPFALRALGIVREDEELVRAALERFETLGVPWQAAQTRALLD